MGNAKQSAALQHFKIVSALLKQISLQKKNIFHRRLSYEVCR
jgi:hypothetical protein